MGSIAVQPPSVTQILVIGGGPAGSNAATVLAREGFNVVLLEAAKFPRYHIGESLLPSVRPFLSFIGAEEDVKAYGFIKKPGGAVKLKQDMEEGYTDFVARDPESGSWQVIRSEFDELLLRHAEKCGVTVIENTKVTDIHFDQSLTDDDDTLGRPVAASWKSASGDTGRIAFDYLVDASGRNGIMSTRYTKNRRYNQTLKNIAVWGYWKGVNKYKPGTSREGAIWVEALTDESGWVWFIPLHDGTTSVGVVMDESTSIRKKKASGHGTHDFYMDQLHSLAPETLRLIGEGTLQGADGNNVGTVKSASDYSYSASSYSGDRFRVAGDAGAFIDPFFSSGVHLAFTGALSAAVTIAASIRGHISEREAGLWHDEKVSTSYTRFLLVVLGVYKQIRNQSEPVMTDVGEENFNRAFDLIRPVIQGTADVGKVVTEDELQKTMDFMWHVVGPHSPEMQSSVASRVASELLSPTAPILSKEEMAKIVGPEDEEAMYTLAHLNASKPLRPLLKPSEDFSTQPHRGYVAVLKMGQLGLVTGGE